MKHKMQFTYARSRVRVTCSCGEAQTKWHPDTTHRNDLKALLIRAHPRQS